MKCKEEGLIDHIVISTHLPGPQVKEIIQKNEFEGVLLGVNILNFPYRWEGVQAAYEAQLGVVAMNPLSGGLIPQYEREFVRACARSGARPHPEICPTQCQSPLF